MADVDDGVCFSVPPAVCATPGPPHRAPWSESRQDPPRGSLNWGDFVVTCNTVYPLTSKRIGTPLFCVPVTATADNGLKKDSEAMADKLATLRRDRIGAVIGRLDDPFVDQIDSAVLLWLGLRQ